MLTVSKTSIVTGICCGKIDAEIDLFQLFEKLEIDEDILGAKFHGDVKGKMENNRSFFNQITLIVKIPEKTVNVKIFGNGNLHFSGIKHLGHAQDCMKVVKEKIRSIQGTEEIEVACINGVLYNKKNYEKYSACKEKNRFEMTKIYSYPDREGKVKAIGFKKHDEHIINKENCVIEGDYFVSSKFKEGIKKIFNKSGEEIGYYTYISKYKRKNVILKGKRLVQESDDVVTVNDLYGNNVGSIVKTMVFNETLSVPTSNFFAIDYRCLEDYASLENLNLEISNLNCKFTVSSPCGNFFDKESIHYLLSTDPYNLESYLNTESGYQGLSVKMYYESKKVSILFFRTGTVLLSGCSTKAEIVRAKATFVKILQDNKDCVIKKDMVEMDDLDESLTIWDI